MPKLMQIDAPHMCAGLEYDDSGMVTKAAPILQWAIGRKVHFAIAWCEKKKYKYTIMALDI